ncbi:MAG: Tfp pilus assembly protein FimT/FimU [Capsulimonadaceae bacterium]
MSTGASSTTRAFTLAEITVVLTVLVLMTAVIIPRAVSVLDSRRAKALDASIARLPIEAKNMARKNQEPVRIRVDGASLVMELAPPGDAAQTEKTIELGSDVETVSAQLNGQNVAADAFEWEAYPDGTCDSGGIEFMDGRSEQSLVMSTDGTVRWLTGALPDVSQDHWIAGQLLTRS